MQVCVLKSDVFVDAALVAEDGCGPFVEIEGLQRRWRCDAVAMAMVRTARSGDEPGPAEVRVRGWQRGYDGIIDDVFLAAMSLEENEQRWSVVLAEQGGQRKTFVVDIGSDEAPNVIGFSSFGPYRTVTGDDKTLEIAAWAELGTVGEVYGFYLHPDHWGSGLADELMDASISALVDDGWPTVRLWVLAENAGARRFYERHGWRADGETQPLTIPGRPIEARYARTL